MALRLAGAGGGALLLWERGTLAGASSGRVANRLLVAFVLAMVVFLAGLSASQFVCPVSSWKILRSLNS